MILGDASPEKAQGADISVSSPKGDFSHRNVADDGMTVTSGGNLASRPITAIEEKALPKGKDLEGGEREPTDSLAEQ